MVTKQDFVKISDWLWELPQKFRSDMRVPTRVYASEKMLEESLRDRSVEQLVNVATLPGIYKYALAMPDIHEGYGFPIGGVAAMDVADGVISPGGIGYDINCGVRLLRSDKLLNEVKPTLRDIGRKIFHSVPSGVGRSGILKLKGNELDAVLVGGARKMVEMNYGKAEDLNFLEAGGRLEAADSSLVSNSAKSRGSDQLGTMGAGNHFVEVGYVEEIFDQSAAQAFGIFQNQITVLIHTGSRGFGHQVATDYIKIMMKAMPNYGIQIPDRELACVPFRSQEGQNYFKAMSAAANFAWANRQLITWEVRQAWKEIFGIGSADLEVIYDVSHNIAKIEEYDGRELVVHRKGATRAFGKDNQEIVGKYRAVGQPVIIPGSMGTASYILAGSEGAMLNSFGTTCHGAGRAMSRTTARKQVEARALERELAEEGIQIFAGSLRGVAEEAPLAYKDIDSVVEAVHQADIAKKVARLKPLVVVKG